MSEKQQISTKNLEYRYSAIHVANSFVEMGIARKEPLDLLRLVKFVYFAKGWHFAFYDEPLFTERVQAWQYGPVVLSVYYAFKNNFSTLILRPEFEFDFERDRQGVKFVRADDRRTMETLHAVWRLYRSLSASSLINLTHADDTPWKMFYKEHANVEIPDKDIAKHFKKKQIEYQAIAEERARISQADAAAGTQAA